MRLAFEHHRAFGECRVHQRRAAQQDAEHGDRCHQHHQARGVPADGEMRVADDHQVDVDDVGERHHAEPQIEDRHPIFATEHGDEHGAREHDDHRCVDAEKDGRPAVVIDRLRQIEGERSGRQDHVRRDQADHDRPGAASGRRIGVGSA